LNRQINPIKTIEEAMDVPIILSFLIVEDEELIKKLVDSKI
tara:strand:+ start:349 stop:471 length:123 start_codon:yes stop_codon:yes gene_type:complete